MEQLPGETRELTKRPSKRPSQGDQPQLFWWLPCSHAP
jgi:hypothetical protein